MRSISALLPVRNYPTRETQNAIFAALTLLDSYQELVLTEDDYTVAVQELRAHNIEELIEKAAHAFFVEVSSKRASSPKDKKQQARGIAKTIDTWHSRLTQNGRYLAASGLVGIELALAHYVQKHNKNLAKIAKANNVPTTDPTLAWGTRCAWSVAKSHAYKSPGFLTYRFDTWSSDTAQLLHRFVGNWCSPGQMAEEYIRANDVLLYDAKTPEFLKRHFDFDRWAIAINKTGDYVNGICLNFWRGSDLVQAYYSRDLRELYILTPIFTLRRLFRLWDMELVYEGLLSQVELFLEQAIVDEAITIVHKIEEPKKATAGNRSDVNAESEETAQAEIEEPVGEDPYDNDLDNECLPGIVASTPKPRHVKNLTHREALNTFQRLGVSVRLSHHTMLSRNGVTVNLLSPHQKDGQIVRKSAQKACRALGIPWADFVAAVY